MMLPQSNRDRELASVKKQFARYDISDPHRESVGCLHDDPNYPIPPEKGLWLQVFHEALEDFFKLSSTKPHGWSDQCVTCHEEAPCGCIQPYEESLAKQLTATHRRKKDLLFRKDWRDCPHAHNNHECAIRWLASDEIERGSFRWIMDELGLDYRWVRKSISAMDLDVVKAKRSWE